MRTTEVKIEQQGDVPFTGNGYVLQETDRIILIRLDLDTAFNNESMSAEPSQLSIGVWISPCDECIISEMTLISFPEFRKHSVFSTSAINSGRSVAVCLVLGDVFA